jgi:HEAT repeat protein
MRASLTIVFVLSLIADFSHGQVASRQFPAYRPDDLDRSLEVLREAVMSRDYETRLFAVQALGAVRTIDATRWLEHALGDPEHDVRVAAVESLRHLGSARAAALLRSVRDDKHESLDIRALAVSALLGSPTP